MEYLKRTEANTPVEVFRLEREYLEKWVRVLRFLKDAENQNFPDPSDLWCEEGFYIDGLCNQIGAFILTAMGRNTARIIANVEISETVNIYKDIFLYLKSVCDLVELAREYSAEPEELERNQVAPLDKTPRAEKYFNRAIELGYMKKQAPCGEGYKWIWGGNRGAKARLAYFLERVFCPKPTDKIRGADRVWLEKLFDVTRLDRAFDQNADAGKSESVREWRGKIDTDIFFD